MLSVKVDRIPILPIGDSVDQGPTRFATHESRLRQSGQIMDLFSSRRWKQKAVVFVLNPEKIMQHMHGIIP